MNSGGYIKFILTVLVLVVALFGYLIVNGLDRARESNLRVLEKLEELPNRLASTPAGWASSDSGRGVTADGSPQGRAGRPQPAGEFANAAYFDPAAETGGRLITAAVADTVNMNPLINNDATASEFQSLCGAALAARDYQNPEEFQPMIAESWTISPDHKTYRFKLRQGIYWHDFTDPVTGVRHTDVEVTAHDFKFYIDAVKNPDVNCEYLKVYYQDLDEVVVIDDYEFEVRWKEEYYNSLIFTLGMTPLPRHLYWAYEGEFDGKRFNEDHVRNRLIVGCGPYMFVRWDKDQRVIFRRNPRYFGIEYGAGPSIEYLVFELIKHPNTRFQALLSGDIDQLGLLPDQWVNRTEEKPFRDGELTKYHYLSRSYTYIGWNQRNPLFADPTVRRALTLLIDREKIKQTVYFDLCRIVAGPFFPESKYSDPTLQPWPCDPAAARALLAEAGWKDEDGDGILEKEGQKFTFTMLQVATNDIQKRMMPMIRESLAAAGIDMKIQEVEWSVYVQRLEQRNFEACSLGWTSPIDPDPYQVWHSSQADLPGSSNHIGFKNAEADQIIEELRNTFDSDRRVELVHRFERILHEEQPYTFLFAPYSLRAQSSAYRNLRIFPAGVSNDIMWVPRAEQKQVPGL